jgi:hypothetical protein
MAVRAGATGDCCLLRALQYLKRFDIEQMSHRVSHSTGRTTYSMYVKHAIMKIISNMQILKQKMS